VIKNKEIVDIAIDAVICIESTKSENAIQKIIEAALRQVLQMADVEVMFENQ
jgi:hypothetical protein